MIVDLPSITIKTYIAVILARMMLKRIEHRGLGSCLLFLGEIFALNFLFSITAKTHYIVMFSKKIYTLNGISLFRHGFILFYSL